MLINLSTQSAQVRAITTPEYRQAESERDIFINVKMPAQDLAGKEDKSWTHAKYLLTDEHINIATLGLFTRD